MTEVTMMSEVHPSGRNGHGQLVHFFIPEETNDGFKRAIERDLADNYRVKVHKHKYQASDELEKCECEVTYRGDEIA